MPAQRNRRERAPGATAKEASEEERALARDVAESFWTATKTGTDELQHEPKLYEIALKGLAVPDLPQEDCSPPPQLESLVFCVLLQVAPNY